MIVALLASLTVTTWSGTEIYAIWENAGPRARSHANGSVGLLRFDMLATACASEVDSDDHCDSHRRNAELDSAEESWEEVHAVSANFTFFLIILYVAGNLLSNTTHRENLVEALLTGRKRA